MKQHPISGSLALTAIAPAIVLWGVSLWGVSAATAQNTVPTPSPDNSMQMDNMPSGNTDTVTSGAAVTAAPITPQDYVNNAAVGDMFEIESSKLALTKSDDKEVKTFARHMIQDHEQTSAKLQGVIKEKNVNVVLPSHLDQAHLEMLDKLQAAKGADFDKLYVAMQVQGHREALKLHQGYADNGDAAELKTFATVIAPMVDKHLSRIEQIAKSMKITT
jgi:putative membrane protein